jgi:hypothetical protein
MKEILSATRINTLLACPRRHYWRFEVGLQRDRDADALRFGSAWHTCMEARATGATIEAAFEKALVGKIELDELQVATLSGMLAGYYAAYAVDIIQSVHPEVEFRIPLAGSRSFEAAGKIDGLGVLTDGRLVLIEHKTTGDQIEPDSEYWLRLRGNIQIMQYVLAARALGWDIQTVLYDVARKPAIRPKQIPSLDAEGRKIVLDAQGNRVMKKDGTPRESGDTVAGWTVQTTLETPEDFGDRLAADTRERPEFYFARREVPVMDDDLHEFEVQRLVIARQILCCRGEARRAAKPEHGWPRNVGDACSWCDFAGFCLQNGTIDTAHPPAGFRISATSPELSQPAQATP